MRNYPLLLLAAGVGEHSNTPKGLVEYNGRPWILRQLKRAAALHCHRVVIVCGDQFRDYCAAVPWMERARDKIVRVEGMKVSTTVVDHPELGVFAALQAGARALDDEKYVGAYVLPIDVPVGMLETWTHLRAHLTGDLAACVPSFSRRAGYPVLLAHRYLTTLTEMPPESQLDVQLRILPPKSIERFEVDDPSVGMSVTFVDQWHKIVEAEPIS